jgi:glycosyltransferase involved in cell wall biosynthesis
MGDTKRPHISVVVPIYRASKFLDELHRRLSETLRAIDPEYELVFVDDCSTDGSWKQLIALQATDPRVRVVRLMKNSGQQRAVLCGFEHARGDLVVTIDEDLQHYPEDIRVLYDRLARGDADMVIGRFEKKRHGLFRSIATRVVKLLSRATVGVPLHLDLTSFRIIRRQVIDEVILLRNFTPVVGFLLFTVSPRIENVVVRHNTRAGEKSGYTLRALVDYFLCMMIDYSDLPLRAVGYFGVGSAAVSVGLGSYYLQLFVRGHIGVRGFPTLVLISLLFFGLTLMSLGIIGTYLRRIVESSNVTRMFVVRDRLGFGDSPKEQP